MPRIEIGSPADDPRALGRPLMSDHNFTARLWASGALVSVPPVGMTALEWWLPLHLALLGTVSQAIVGGQLMFSTTLGLARGPSRRTTLIQLAFLNIGAMLVITGRIWGSAVALALGASSIALVLGWVMWLVDRQWRRSVNRPFRHHRDLLPNGRCQASSSGSRSAELWESVRSMMRPSTLHNAVSI